METKKPEHCPAFIMSKILFENYLSKVPEKSGLLIK
jgi:hypothetical protein